ncbi:MAG: DUF4143 domain-containing protein, partial [Patescibacteria group bacterium]|nr:DUF4143 domain-containing protein [Patescibacteria group bacterium]
DCGISQPTAKAWLSVLETSFIAFRLPPFSGNLGKRLVKMPKLHFYDTGLVCWWLGIRTPHQLRNHPLRGPIFETWVASEILKHRTNAGERGGLYFYRDRSGVEGDLIVEYADRSTLLEAKAAQTATSDLLGGARRVRDILSVRSPCSALVVYGGDDRQERSDLTLLPWNRLHEQPWT